MKAEHISAYSIITRSRRVEHRKQEMKRQDSQLGLRVAIKHKNTKEFKERGKETSGYR